MKRILLLLSILAVPAAARAQDGRDGKDTAWNRSVAAEVAGDLTVADDILVEAWGEDGGNYYVRLRRAYLALLQGRFSQAEARYAALQGTPEGETDPDVVAGLRAAKTRTLPEGIHAADPLARSNPEIWGAFVGQTLGGSRYLGGAIFAHVPVRITPEIRLHAAGRYVRYQRQGGGSPWAFSNAGGRTVSVSDLFLGADYQRRWWGLDAVGAYEKLTGDSAIVGGGVRARGGDRAGVIVDGSVLASSGNTTNCQVVPMAFVWPTNEVGLRAGARLTFDDRQSASALAGASLFFRGHALHLDGHLGNERSALNPTTFSLMNLSADATLGGTLTLVLRIVPTLRLLFQTQGERLKKEGAEGAYFAVSVGVDVSLGSL
jgi:hypothetical protein